ncbi:signal transduction histidine kinase/ActR/RegA family two-component response regulator [Janthinobacterium sp. CG_23.3]|uniref:hybrid sensor histidine kinase/response regulator n=1 Tax=Janthinobacterium sp. CG_23.3 TaxID=3349634 RepID=UPI0038D3A750
MKIRVYLMLTALAVLIPVMVSSAVALSFLHEFGRVSALRSLEETARATALTVDRELASAEAALHVLASSPYLATGDMAAFYQQAITAGRGKTAWALLLDANGQQIINTLVPYGTPMPPAVAKARAQEVIRTQTTLVSGLLPGPLLRKPVTTVNVPVPLDGGKRYVLVEAFAAEHFSGIVATTRMAEGSVVAIIDKQGRFIARNVNAAARIGAPARPELVAAAAARRDGYIRHTTLENVEVYDVFTHSPISGWTIAVAAPVEQIETAAIRAATVAALGMLVALLLALAAATYLGRRLVRSLDVAKTAAKALSAAEVPVIARVGVVEVDELQDALSEASTILLQEQQARKFVEEQRKHLLVSEQNARQLAENQNKAKDTFLAMLGHELRNPLSAISAATVVIKLTTPDAPASVRAHQIIERQSKHLERIVSDLLDVSRMLSGKIELSYTGTNLSDVVRESLQALDIAGRTLGLTVELDLQAAWIFADRTRLDQIVTNIISNAIKYTPKPGTIRVTIRVDAQHAVLSVTDTGVGMDADLVAKAFDPFVQGTVSLDRSQGGLGLGLTLVRELVRLHGGTVSASSAGRNCGSTFTVALPGATELLRPEPDMANLAHGGVSPHRVLLIEDNEDARSMVKVMLELSGCVVVEAANGADGITVAQRELPAVAIVDIGLPDVNGFEVAARLRNAPGTRSIALIALSGYGRPEDIEAARAAGFDLHLVKPVRREQLCAAIETVLGSMSSAV